MSDRTITIPNEDSDITLFLPNGEAIVLQYRVEGTFPSLDICFEKKRTVYNWGRDMMPAKGHRPDGKKARKGEFEVFQLWIGLDPSTETYLSTEKK